MNTSYVTQFRYREMVYRPEFYSFNNDDREEWFPNGIFNYNVSRMIKDLENLDGGNGSDVPWLQSAFKVHVSVEDVLNHSYGGRRLEEEHIQAADLERPLLFAELAPDSFNLIDGHHRLEKARREGVMKLPAWMVDAHAGIHYLGSEYEYSRYADYWNSKVEDVGDLSVYKGFFCPCPALLKERDLTAGHIWNRMAICLNESRRIELYSKGQWFTLFRLNNKVFCGEAEAHEPSIRCQTPFRITPEMVEGAVQRYVQWSEAGAYAEEKRKEIRKKIRHADVIMACIRVFSEY